MSYRGGVGPTLVAKGIADPEGITAGPPGHLYVVEQVKNRIDDVSLDGSGSVTPVKVFDNPRHLLGLDSIRSEANGSILVPDSPNGRLVELDPATGALRTIVGGLGRPVDVVPFQGGYVVADETLGLVLVQAAAPGTTSVKVSRVPQVGGSDDLAVDAGGTLYITGLNNGVLYRYRGGRASTLVRGFGDPQGLAIEADGSLLVADSTRNALLRLPAACLSA